MHVFSAARRAGSRAGRRGMAECRWRVCVAAKGDACCEIWDRADVGECGRVSGDACKQLPWRARGRGWICVGVVWISEGFVQGLDLQCRHASLCGVFVSTVRLVVFDGSGMWRVVGCGSLGMGGSMDFDADRALIG